MVKYVVAVAVCGAVLAGCASPPVDGPQTPPLPSLSSGELMQDAGDSFAGGGGLEILRGDSFADWVTFSDHVVTVTVMSEADAAPPAQDEVDAGEGMIPRTVDYRVDSIHWSRDGAPAVPAEYSSIEFGWLFKGDKRTEFNVPGSPRITVGRQYVMAIVDYGAPGPHRWGALSLNAILPVSAGTVGGQEIRGMGGHVYAGRSNGEADVRDAAWGHPVESLARSIREATPHADADTIGKLPANRRYGAYMESQETVNDRP